MSNHVIIPYSPRDFFHEYHATNKKMLISVCHRRAGKTVARINKMLREALTCKLPRPQYAYLAPTRSHAKDIAWTYLKDYARPLFDYGAYALESELTLKLPNGAMISLYGAHNADRMRGKYFDGIVIDEAQDISLSVLSQIIMPALTDRAGYMDISGTPKGWTNVLGQLYKKATEDPRSWYAQLLPVSQTNIITADQLERARAFMTDDQYEQEFECSFDAAIAGAVYAKYIQKAQAEDRLNHSIEAHGKVYTAWDLGWGDSTAIWWWQMVGEEIHLLDYYENCGKDVRHYTDVLRQKAQQHGYKYHTHYAPHDVCNKHLAAGGKSVFDVALVQGIRLTRIPATSQANQIESTRASLQRCWFDKKTNKGLDALKHYHFKYDDKNNSWSDNPHHDWSSHGCDAFEIIAQVWHIARKELDKNKPAVFWESLTIKELQKLDDKLSI